jgi:glycosyltransferase involved in cell wall biosynthesis
VVGTGSYRDELEIIAKEVSVADRVYFLGYVASQRLSRLYAGADIFLHFSEFEAYGITVAEALAAGTPCVVRRERALTDWTTLQGCAGISDLDPNQILNAVDEVAKSDPNVDLQTWDDVVYSLLNVYSTNECESPVT